MRGSSWLRPPRHVLVLFLAVTLVPAAAVGWLSWQLLKQDRALEAQRLQERLDRAADLIAAALDHRLSETEDALAGLADPAEDAVIVTCLPHGIEVRPAGRLPYLPVVPTAPEPSPGVFEAGEALEFRHRDHAGAIAEFRDLAGASDPGIRAGALVRLGRVLRKAGRHQEALDVCDRLAAAGTTPVGGMPAELVARTARLTVLDALGQTAEAERAAQALGADLEQGRWALDRVTYAFLAQEVERRRGGAVAPAADRRLALALAAGVETLWDEWQALRRGDGSQRGRRSIWVHERGVLLLWTSTPDRLVALAAGPAYIESAWPDARQDLGVALTLVDAASHVVFEQAAPAGQPQTMRAMADTGLPWTLKVASANPAADLAELAGRRRLLLAGLAMMGVVIVAAGYFTTRAVTRELAVARLQSDFVSAVSHEFRTPLTSMRHLTELLDRGVVSEEDRRKQYYAALAHETSRLHRLVESLLDFGRMEAGAVQYRVEPVNLVELVEEVVAEFRQERPADGRRIELHTGEPVPDLRADREALGRALWNLLDNAVKYSPGDTPVRVDLAPDRQTVAIRVRDQGPGIPAAERQQIFTKFVRGSAARASHVKGTGIGLAMVHHIVRAHRGQLRLESEPGRGSTFSIVLPLLPTLRRRPAAL